MDSGTIMAMVVLALVGTIFYIISNRMNKRKEAKLLQTLLVLAQKDGCTLQQQEHWRRSTIGLDEVNGKVFYTRELPDSLIGEIVNLANTKNCWVNNVNRTVTRNKDTFNVVDRIDLVFKNLDNSKKDTILEFYNIDYDSLTLNNELELARKWCTIINDKIAVIKS